MEIAWLYEVEVVVRVVVVVDHIVKTNFSSFPSMPSSTSSRDDSTVVVGIRSSGVNEVAIVGRSSRRLRVQDVGDESRMKCHTSNSLNDSF